MEALRAASERHLRNPVTFIKTAVPWSAIYTSNAETRSFYSRIMNCMTVEEMTAISTARFDMEPGFDVYTFNTIAAIRNALHVAIMMYPFDAPDSVSGETDHKRQRTCSPMPVQKIPEQASDAVSSAVHADEPAHAASAAHADEPDLVDETAEAVSPTPEDVRHRYRYSSTTPPPPPEKKGARVPVTVADVHYNPSSDTQ